MLERDAHVEWHTRCGNADYARGRFEAAIASYDRALELDPGFAGGYYNRALALFDLRRHAEALVSADRAVALKPDHVGAHALRGDALIALGRFPAAAAAFERAIALEPGNPDHHNCRGNALHQMGATGAALESYDRALALAPGYAGVHLNRAQMLEELGNSPAAVVAYERALELKPDLPLAAGQRLLARLQHCDWRDFDTLATELCARVERGELVATPFTMLALSGSARLQRRAAEVWVRAQLPPSQVLPPLAQLAPLAPLALPTAGTALSVTTRAPATPAFATTTPAIPAFATPSHGSTAPTPLTCAKLKVGYFSADFCNHAVSALTAGLFETHDRSRFKVVAFSLGRNTQDATRQRLEKAFDRFHDVDALPDLEVAQLARREALDIAVDLTGFTKQGRPTIFALRAAPIQISYLGFLGTMGTPFMDYLIADAALIPSNVREHYAERIVYLPSYQANDSRRPAPAHTLSRSELGLPAEGFVFCCFNASYKITPRVFGGWMRILARVPTSVLFLYATNEATMLNLRHEAKSRGVDPARLVFGGRLPAEQYLARYAAADLFLDTLPYNGGATASDALWSGLPVLTLSGETFASRMGRSLLEALELPELIADSPQDYEERAVQLAKDPPRLARLRQQLVERRGTARLFDTVRHTRSLEAAYHRLWARHAAGLPPADDRAAVP